MHRCIFPENLDNICYSVVAEQLTGYIKNGDKYPPEKQFSMELVVDQRFGWTPILRRVFRLDQNVDSLFTPETIY